VYAALWKEQHTFVTGGAISSAAAAVTRSCLWVLSAILALLLAVVLWQGHVVIGRDDAVPEILVLDITLEGGHVEGTEQLILLLFCCFLH
jgi:hypothetical protein